MDLLIADSISKIPVISIFHTFSCLPYLYLYHMENRKALVEQGLRNLGITKLTPMQEEVITAIEQHEQVVVLSPTGSGKTLAFLVPIVHTLKDNAGFIQAIVITPTRELALQIEQVFRQLKTGFKVVCCYGGHPFWIEANSLKEPPALLIGTPGRLADHIRRGTVSPELTSMLVLDEFDKSLELGYSEEMEQVLMSLESLQKLVLTSATEAVSIPTYVPLINPHKISYLGTGNLSQRLNVKIARASHHDKYAALLDLIAYLGDSTLLVFVNHRDAADRLCGMLLEDGVVSDSFHGGLEQSERERALVKFRNGSIKILVATDLAARGLDIPEIENVIHYQLPDEEDAFIHRNGRTARMKASGSAILILGEDEETPAYINSDYETLSIEPNLELPPVPEWSTIYIGAGRKDKLSKVDIVGFLIQKGEIDKTDIGKIDIMDKMSFVTVKRELAADVVMRIRRLKIKKMSPQISLSW